MFFEHHKTNGDNMNNKIKKYLTLFLPISFIFSLVVGSLFYLTAIILPPPLINQSYVITYLDNNGNELFSTHFNNEGNYISINQMSPYLVSGYVLIEDKRFYSHNGLDLTRIIKAMISNTLNKGIVEGGSTITQQLSRILYLDNSQTITRKVKEAFISARIEMNYSKKEILEYYLNSLYFGHGVYGVEDASMFYFGVHAYQLSIAQAAMLIGISNAPTLYSPINNYQNSKTKQHIN